MKTSLREKKKKEDSWEWFDDCEICHACKKAEKQERSLSLSELTAAFAKQNARNEAAVHSRPAKPPRS